MQKTMGAAEIARTNILPGFLLATAGYSGNDLCVGPHLEIFARNSKRTSLIALKRDFTGEGRIEPTAWPAIDGRMKAFAANLSLPEAWTYGLEKSKIMKFPVTEHLGLGIACKEFCVKIFGRIGDVDKIKQKAARWGFMFLDRYIDQQGGDGSIYWRERPEMEVHHAPYVVMVDEFGPDHDAMTDKRCFMDHDHFGASFYARLAYIPNATKAAEAPKKEKIDFITINKMFG